MKPGVCKWMSRADCHVTLICAVQRICQIDNSLALLLPRMSILALPVSTRLLTSIDDDAHFLLHDHFSTLYPALQKLLVFDDSPAMLIPGIMSTSIYVLLVNCSLIMLAIDLNKQSLRHGHEPSAMFWFYVLCTGCFL